MLRIVEKWMDAELVYEKNGYFLRVLLGDQIKSVIKLMAENDDDARKKARRAIYLFLA
ncbi:hypothetical protein [Methylomicrobium lacus]|uniref:hypothetical protein n=1 Tax=Methylomicrobium lacus TaxID=136992 RepID=UPI0004ACC9A5|nr:hypothetical protein [Methylomicrobium lacus]